MKPLDSEELLENINDASDVIAEFIDIVSQDHEEVYRETLGRAKVIMDKLNALDVRDGQSLGQFIIFGDGES